MKYSSAMRPQIVKRLEKMGRADIVVGIPSLNNQSTIAEVMEMISHGLRHHYADLRSVIIVSDGGSTDDTRDVAKDSRLRPWQEKVVGTYRGPPGKGSALRMVFEAAHLLNARACLVADAELRSISNSWVKTILEPILDHHFDFVAACYAGYQYDGTMTKTDVYGLFQEVFGTKVGQPIGRDFAFSRNLVSFYMDENVRENAVPPFSIDILRTVQAVDQSETLNPVFRQEAAYQLAISGQLIQMRFKLRNTPEDGDQAEEPFPTHPYRTEKQESAPFVPPL
jgi:glycosyltransferase involved in cell wall biosynthesis